MFCDKITYKWSNCEDDGIMSPVAGVLGSLQANEVIKTILDTKK